MRREVDEFERDFAHWDLHLPPEAVDARRGGQIRQGGWSIRYNFGRDPLGEYLDYYASPRDVQVDPPDDDWHVRLYVSGERVALPPVLEAYMYGRDPSWEELERARAHYLEQLEQLAPGGQAASGEDPPPGEPLAAGDAAPAPPATPATASFTASFTASVAPPTAPSLTTSAEAPADTVPDLHAVPAAPGAVADGGDDAADGADGIGFDSSPAGAVPYLALDIGLDLELQLEQDDSGTPESAEAAATDTVPASDPSVDADPPAPVDIAVGTSTGVSPDASLPADAPPAPGVAGATTAQEVSAASTAIELELPAADLLEIIPLEPARDLADGLVGEGVSLPIDDNADVAPITIEPAVALDEVQSGDLVLFYPVAREAPTASAASAAPAVLPAPTLAGAARVVNNAGASEATRAAGNGAAATAGNDTDLMATRDAAPKDATPPIEAAAPIAASAAVPAPARVEPAERPSETAATEPLLVEEVARNTFLPFAPAGTTTGDETADAEGAQAHESLSEMPWEDRSESGESRPVEASSGPQTAPSGAATKKVFARADPVLTADVATIDGRVAPGAFRPWWFRPGARRTAILLAAAVIVAISATSFAHHRARVRAAAAARADSALGDSLAGAAPPGGGSAPASTDSAAHPDTAQQSAATAPDTVGSAQTAPRDTTVDPSARLSPVPEGVPRGSDEGLARPSGPGTLPPIIRSSAPGRPVPPPTATSAARFHPGARPLP